MLWKGFVHTCKAKTKIWKAETENDQLQPKHLLPVCSECAIGPGLLIIIRRDGSVPCPPLGFQEHWVLRAWAANAIIETAALLSKYFIHSPSKMLMDHWHVPGLFCRYESQTQPLARYNYWRAFATAFSALSQFSKREENGRRWQEGCSEAIVGLWTKFTSPKRPDILILYYSQWLKLKVNVKYY